jgi:hypothetical protein
MPLAVKKTQERTIARCGNSAVLYLPKGYFIPGETVNLDLQIDFDGNLKLTLKKCLFNFNCNQIKAALTGFKIDNDQTVDGTRSFSATKDAVSLDCSGFTRELEPTYITISRLFENVTSLEAYAQLTNYVDVLMQKCPDAYIEPEGNIDTVKTYQDPKKHHLENEVQAFELLLKNEQKLDFSVIVKFNSKKHKIDAILEVLGQFGQNDEVLLDSSKKFPESA